MKQRLEKYSERFDNKDNELVEGIFNPDTWGKRLVDDVPKQESQNLKNFKKLVSNEVSPAMKDFIKEKEITLEESAENFWLNDDSMTDNDRISYVNGFKQGAKWQQERSYSEEDMEIAFGTISTNWISFEQFIKQFKNK